MPKMPQGTRKLVASAILCAALLAACRDRERQEEVAQNQSLDAPAPRPLPIVEPPFNRSRLLLTVIRAASAHSTGQEDPNIRRMLDGKQFEVRLRFGCDGQGPGKGDHGWSVDPDGRTLRLRALPNLSLADATVQALAGDGVEAVEGFWLTRPWQLQAACPVQLQQGATPAGDVGGLAEGAPDAKATPISAGRNIPSVGIAQFFSADDTRTGRRMNRPFEAVKKLDEGERAGKDGFNLVLAGRLRARHDGRVILCAGSGRDRPPDCIVSVDVDRVWIERPEDKEVMAEWSA